MIVGARLIWRRGGNGLIPMLAVEAARIGRVRQQRSILSRVVWGPFKILSGSEVRLSKLDGSEEPRRASRQGSFAPGDKKVNTFSFKPGVYNMKLAGGRGGGARLNTT